MNSHQRRRDAVRRFPIWNYLVLLLVLVSSVVYALPNVYGKDPSILVTSNRKPIATQPATQQNIIELLSAHGIQVKSQQISNNDWRLRFDNVNTQFRAYDLIAQQLPKTYSISYSLVSRSPQWLSAIGAAPMNLGLDLQGGIHLLYQVDMEVALDKAIQQWMDEQRLVLQNAAIHYHNIKPLTTAGQRGTSIAFTAAAERDKALAVLNKVAPELAYGSEDSNTGFVVVATIPAPVQAQIKQRAMAKNISVFRNRANELGVSEPLIQQQGADRILVELPGVQNPERVKEILGSTATLEFRLAYEPE